MKLVIVESPTKCQTIGKYLGSDYKVVASKGHIRDLSTKANGGLGVDVDNAYAPTYVIIKGKESLVSSLAVEAKKAEEVILATDPDREGEAIAWHIAQALKLDEKKNKRLEFHEITRDSILEAIKNPRTIDFDIVQSQETRRIIDRIVGFKLSNLMKKKIRSKSAGRVQSTTLKMILDHQEEIDNFVPQEYWNFDIAILVDGKEVKLSYISKNKDELVTKELAQDVLTHIGNTLKVSDIKTEIRLKNAPEPLMTATLQQEAFSRLGFSASRTMKIAQMLYEGVSINGEHTGLITYMRTDVTRLSSSFMKSASEYILNKYGNEYLASGKSFKKDSRAQDAHEAIRPTSVNLTPEVVRPFLTPDQYALYKLIYNHTLAYFIKPKKDEVLVVKFNINGNEFKCEFKRNIFLGYNIINNEKDNEYTANIPQINVNDEFLVAHKESEQKYTEAPGLYTEAKIVKLMQEAGIGRPSTYASTIELLKKREYIISNKGEISITDQGKKTAYVLHKYFPNIVNAKYTADMENELDKVQDGKASKNKILDDFYVPFMEQYGKVAEIMYKDNPIETGEKCPICGAPLVVKQGKNGTFIGCGNYPTCKYIQKEEKPAEDVKEVGRNCPVCGKPLVYRKDKSGKKTFIACSGFPTCRYTETEEQVYTEKDYVKKCPDCDGYLVKKKGKYGYFLGCTNYPTCNHMEKISKKGRK